MPLTFAVTWDYRCPFARNAHEHVLDALADGADWDVTFVPFSLGQVHVEEGEPDVWDNPERTAGCWRSRSAWRCATRSPSSFLAVHRRAVRPPPRRRAGRCSDRAGARATCSRHRASTPTPCSTEIATGRPLATIKDEHTAYAASHQVWGVPTFIVGDQAVFVRLMNRPERRRRGRHARRSSGCSTCSSWPELNEFKHTSIPR